MAWLASVSSRKRKIWLSVAATVLGTGALTQVALWVQAARNTDLNDRTVGITAGDSEARVEAAPVRFRDVAVEYGVVMRHGPGPRHRFLPEDTGSGLAWGDCDGDGDFDLYVVNMATENDAGSQAECSHLYRNDGTAFVDITDAGRRPQRGSLWHGGHVGRLRRRRRCRSAGHELWRTESTLSQSGRCDV